MNKALADFGAYGAALMAMGVDAETLYDDHEILGEVVDGSIDSPEEAEEVRDYYIAKFKEAVVQIVEEYKAFDEYVDVSDSLDCGCCSCCGCSCGEREDDDDNEA